MHVKCRHVRSLGQYIPAFWWYIILVYTPYIFGIQRECPIACLVGNFDECSYG